jgi:hypothetical protein
MHKTCIVFCQSQATKLRVDKIKDRTARILLKRYTRISTGDLVKTHLFLYGISTCYCPLSCPSISSVVNIVCDLWSVSQNVD